MLTLVAPVQGLDPWVERIRDAHDFSARLGVPAHVTLAGDLPQRPSPEALDLLRREACIPVTLRGPERLGEAACLLPEDPRPLRALCRRVARATGAEPISDPHVTLARGLSGEQLEELTERLRPVVPARVWIRRALLLSHDGGAAPVGRLEEIELGAG